SSVAARYGNTGQSDYAMANEILNRVAHGMKAANPGACVTSLGWGPWDGGMVDDSLRAKFAEMGVSLIPQQDGANLFADALLAGPLCPVELIIGSELGHG
ncbi:KR domain-containing protein, partial [Henriciella pelagia]